MKSLLYPITGLVLLLPLMANSATLGGSAAQDSCTDKYNQGLADGYDLGYEQGKTDGDTQGWWRGLADGDTQGWWRGLADGDSQGWWRGFADGDSQGWWRGFTDGDGQGWWRGFTDGDAQGYTRGDADGYARGLATQLAACIADPQSCDIPLASCIPDALVGETEPNDSFVTADPLEPGTSFWGQLYALNDRDYFYTATTKLNQNLLITFSVPEWLEGANLAEGNPGLWNISVLDAAGNVFASFDSNARSAVQSTPDSLTYSVTLGLAGTYYIRVQPAAGNEINAHAYSVSALVQDSPLGGTQPTVGFYDTEMERNDLPSQGNRLANGVTMYGVINLTFNTPILEEDTAVWGQGEDDWFKYTSPGNEIVTLTFCEKEECPLGNWLVEVYDQSMANRYESGELRENLTPILAINTNNSGDPNRVFRFGLRNAGDYYIRVNHKRLFEAPCRVYRYVTTSGFGSQCACESGNSCDIPTDDCSDSALGLVCRNQIADCAFGIEPGCLSADGADGRLRYPPNCPVFGPSGQVAEKCVTYQTLARCSCSQYGGVVEVPEGSYSSPYNFTWHGTRLPPSTADSDAYADYENRPTPY
ncbi:hypothetical protein [Allochromatium vinosum]|uniref:hypothetical protein n=1 Tax=Allochromatium vinosum TaxID=1049 RepID=UPI0019089873|nr:hypothetical protein [Allochromatium vinosum]MBK1654414.1 hypothetical protein [Allochromatium vinosum]